MFVEILINESPLVFGRMVYKGVIPIKKEGTKTTLHQVSCRTCLHTHVIIRVLWTDIFILMGLDICNPLLRCMAASGVKRIGHIFLEHILFHYEQARRENEISLGHSIPPVGVLRIILLHDFSHEIKIIHVMPYPVKLTVVLELAAGRILQEKPLVQYHLDPVRKYFFDIRDLVEEIEISPVIGE